jgi:hypothetical protein
MSTKFFTTQRGNNVKSFFKENSSKKYIIEDIQKRYLTKYAEEEFKEDKSILTYENVIRYSNGCPMNE